MNNLLEGEGHQVITAEDGFSALNILTSNIPDIMFIDLIMPKIEGNKLCQIVRKMDHLKDCYLVIISAAVAEMNFDYTKIGADACIAKGPFRKMAEDVLTAAKESDSPKRSNKYKPIKGLEEVHPRRVTKELLSQNRHMEAILKSISEGVLEIFSGKIVYANSAAISLFGVSQEEILNSYPQNLFDDIERPQIEALLDSSGIKAGEIELDTPIRLNGRYVTIDQSSI